MLKLKIPNLLHWGMSLNMGGLTSY
ncbi:hypothetical protein MTR67_000926 [Solanum verrucosum]|uniref:Uncharacterized protein n=1 Tax=Solanum verrucosum TaxID=315347 RepID=A0AAF0PRQ2_SOLVR|nr:hypothetical protein MTR67_000926 [Solanum verrucosum]